MKDIYVYKMTEPTGDLNPLEQCFRCGFNIRYTKTSKGVLLYGAEDILRYGPGFTEDKYAIDTDIDEDNFAGQPLITCSADCALDSLSHLFKDNPEQFTIHCIMLSGAYSVQIPGMPPSTITKRFIIDPKQKTLNNDPKKLKRWGGNLTYREYRKNFTEPIHIDVDNHEHTHSNTCDSCNSCNSCNTSQTTRDSINLDNTNNPDNHNYALTAPSDSEDSNDNNTESDVVDTIAIMNGQPTNPVESESESDSESEVHIEHGKTIPDDEDIATDPVHDYNENTEYEPVNDPDADENDFDFIPAEHKKLFQP